MRPKITNDEIVEAVEQAAERKGVTKTEAVRHALRKMYVEIDDEYQTPTKTIEILEDEDMKTIHQALWRMGSESKRDDVRKVPLSSAKSVVAQLMGVSKTVIKQMYIKPLSREQITDVTKGPTGGTVYVVDPDAIVADSDASDETEDREPEIDDPEQAGELIDQAATATDGGIQK